MKTRDIALAAFFGAALSGIKLALAFVPNVELVTLLLAVLAFAFGARIAVLAALVFCTVELYYGITPYVLTYYLHWPILALAFSLPAKLKKPSEYHYLVISVALTALFGIQSSLIYILVGSGAGEGFWTRFAANYVAGAWFYVIHVLSNALIFLILFKPLARAAAKITGGKSL